MLTEEGLDDVADEIWDEEGSTPQMGFMFLDQLRLGRKQFKVI